MKAVYTDHRSDTINFLQMMSNSRKSAPQNVFHTTTKNRNAPSYVARHGSNTTVEIQVSRNAETPRLVGSK